MDKTTLAYMGNGVRSSLLSAHQSLGNPAGLAISRRYLTEVANVISEIHGPEKAVGALYQLADVMATRPAYPVLIADVDRLWLMDDDDSVVWAEIDDDQPPLVSPVGTPIAAAWRTFNKGWFVVLAFGAMLILDLVLSHG